MRNKKVGQIQPKINLDNHIILLFTLSDHTPLRLDITSEIASLHTDLHLFNKLSQNFIPSFSSAERWARLSFVQMQKGGGFNIQQQQMCEQASSSSITTFPQFLQADYIDVIKMTSKLGGQSKVIIPALLNHFQSQVTTHEDRYIHQEEKMVTSPKIFLAPKHESLPIALTLNKNSNSQQTSLKFAPTFQTFDLSQLFSNKPLNEKQAAAFSSLQEQNNQNYQTPVRQSRNDGNWSSFKMIEPHIYATADSIKNQKLMNGQEKKSRPKEKGLRKLSQRAYEIVLKMRSASYKEVANKLVDQLNSQQELDQEGKDEQNIKRRVYDALNVLIALGVLRKQGRKIVGDQSQATFQSNKAKQLYQQTEFKKKELLLKKQKLKDLQDKVKVCSSLAQTNTITNQESQIFEFPFLAVCNENFTKITAQKTEGGECNKIEFKWSKSSNDFRYFDLDLLVSYHQKIQAKLSP